MLQVYVGVLLLLAWCGDLVTGEVGQDFSHCKDSFYKQTPPQGISGNKLRPICQFYKNKFRFATLYDADGRTPVYSAYEVGTPDGKRPEDDWKYEPQLATKTGDKEMKDFEKHVDQNVIESQAVLADYEDSIYSKGHLNPSVHMRTLEDREATFTLTNTVPQREGSNKGPWDLLEARVQERFKKRCTGEMYVITGVIPFDPPHAIPSESKRVSVPEYLWSAYCCTKFQTPLPAPEENFFPTYAAVGRNDPNSPGTIVPKVDPKSKGYDVKDMTLVKLQKILKKKLKMNNLQLFNNYCI